MNRSLAILWNFLVSNLSKKNLAETYPEPCETSKIERFTDIVNDRFLFPRSVPSYMFDRVLDTPLFNAFRNADICS